jgi:DNA-3-methyladenine glycosylase
MFEEGGVAYVYLCYGIHHLFNVVTGERDMGHAILIRAIEPMENIEIMLQRRKMKILKPQLTAGPGVLSKSLGIRKEHTNLSLIQTNSSIWIEDRGEVVSEEEIISSPRVGVGYAEECEHWNWRFRIKCSKWTSPAK